jgi:hypothetical protein
MIRLGTGTQKSAVADQEGKDIFRLHSLSAREVESGLIVGGTFGLGLDTIFIGGGVFDFGFVSAPDGTGPVAEQFGIQIANVGGGECSAAVDGLQYVVANGPNAKPQQTWNTIQNHFLGEFAQQQVGARRS